MWFKGEWFGAKEGSGSLATEVFEVGILPDANEDGMVERARNQFRQTSVP